jgi:hypothetical protein
MSRRVYFIQRQITFSQFANVLAIPSLDVQLDDSPANSYPSVRLKLGDASLMARTNMQGHVVQLDAIARIAMVTARSSIPSPNCSTRKSRALARLPLINPTYSG